MKIISLCNVPATVREFQDETASLCRYKRYFLFVWDAINLSQGKETIMKQQNKGRPKPEHTLYMYLVLFGSQVLRTKNIHRVFNFGTFMLLEQRHTLCLAC